MPRINLYDGNDLKVVADDAIGPVMDSLGYKQHYLYEFVRLSLGFLSVGVAGAVFWIERTYGFRPMYFWIALLCATYVALQCSFYLWKWFVEQNADYYGTGPLGDVRISTKNPANTDKYEISVVVSGAPEVVISLKYPEFIDYNKKVVTDELAGPIKSALAKKKE